jgi:hypothetical protein
MAARSSGGRVLPVGKMGRRLTALVGLQAAAGGPAVAGYPRPGSSGGARGGRLGRPVVASAGEAAKRAGSKRAKRADAKRFSV